MLGMMTNNAMKTQKCEICGYMGESKGSKNEKVLNELLESILGRYGKRPDSELKSELEQWYQARHKEESRKEFVEIVDKEIERIVHRDYSINIQEIEIGELENLKERLK